MSALHSRLLLVGVLSLSLMIVGQAHGWYDKTHVAIARAAGYENWFNAAGADITKSKAADREGGNHYFENPKGRPVDAGLVLEQVTRYDSPSDEEGHLYGAIIASIRKHDELFKARKYVEYHMAFAAHYIGDLSMPNHNIAFMIKHGFPNNEADAWCWHRMNEGVIDSTVLDRPEAIARRMYPITLRDDQFETDLAAEIARIATLSRGLGEKLRAGRRIMTEEEALIQVGHSASLLKAILSHYK